MRVKTRTVKEILKPVILEEVEKYRMQDAAAVSRYMKKGRIASFFAYLILMAILNGVVFFLIGRLLYDLSPNIWCILICGSFLACVVSALCFDIVDPIIEAAKRAPDTPVEKIVVKEIGGQ